LIFFTVGKCSLFLDNTAHVLSQGYMCLPGRNDFTGQFLRKYDLSFFWKGIGNLSQMA